MFGELHPDIVLLDLHMGEANGLDVMRAVHAANAAGPYLPIVILTGDLSSQARRDALDAGAADFIAKPYDPTEVQLRVRNLLATRRLHLQPAKENRSLE